MDYGLIYSYLGAALAVGLAGIGSSIGIGYAGMASSGLLAEEPDKFGKALILVALPGTQGIYGFLVCFLIWLKLGGIEEMTNSKGLILLLAALPVGIGGLFSGIYQGKVSAAGINVLAKKPDDFFTAAVMSVLVETYALLGLVASILIWLKVG
ncbi:V-type ATP synthase subunit K [Planctomycetota bacterium]